MITHCSIKNWGRAGVRATLSLRLTAECAGAKWPAAQATVIFIGGGHDPPDPPPGYGPGTHHTL